MSPVISTGTRNHSADQVHAGQHLLGRTLRVALRPRIQAGGQTDSRLRPLAELESQQRPELRPSGDPAAQAASAAITANCSEEATGARDRCEALHQVPWRRTGRAAQGPDLCDRPHRTTADKRGLETVSEGNGR